jgi:hypothetical protein
MDDVAGWERLWRPGFAVELRYPGVTPQGQVVERTEEQADDHRGDLERVHVMSPDRHELYVELVRFRNCTPQGEYDNHSAALKRQFGDDAVTQLAATTVLELPAWTYSLTSPDHERSLLLLPIGADTYRVIYDPRSALTSRVLETLTVSAGN